MAEPTETPAVDYKAMFFALIASLTMCDNMGDVTEDIWEALKQAGIDPDYAELVEIYKLLPQPPVTLYGTDLSAEDE